MGLESAAQKSGQLKNYQILLPLSNDDMMNRFVNYKSSLIYFELQNNFFIGTFDRITKKILGCVL